MINRKKFTHKNASQSLIRYSIKKSLLVHPLKQVNLEKCIQITTISSRNSFKGDLMQLKARRKKNFLKTSKW